MLCNMEAEEAERHLAAFCPYFLDREEEFASELFKHYLFYETWGHKDLRECTCTHDGCGTFEIYRGEDPNFFSHTHGDELHCPRCGEVVKLIALGRMRSFVSIDETIRVTICRNGPEGAVQLLSGWATKQYSWNDLRPVVDFNEKIRTVLLPGKRMQWQKYREWTGYCYRDAGWHTTEAVKEPFNPFMYTSDGSSYFLFPERLNDSALKYCQLEDWYFEITRNSLEDMRDPSRNVVRYLSAYTEYPNIEMAVKLDLPDAVEELVCCGKKNGRWLNWKGKTPAEFLRMSKQDAKLFMGSGTRMPQLRIFQELRRDGSVDTFENFLKMAQEFGGSRILALIGGVAKDADVRLKDAANYIRKITANKNDMGQTVQLWKDYIGMGRQLGYDMSREDVLMPKNLRQRHDDAAATIRVAKAADELKMYKARYKQLNKLYAFELDGLCIVVPTSTDDIVREGKTLHHCVGGYAARHMKGSVDILFLRNKRKPNTPFITIEMKPRKDLRSKVELVQIHGYKNEGYKKSVKPAVKYKWFLDMWYAWMRSGSKRDKNGKPVIPAEKEKTA